METSQKKLPPIDAAGQKHVLKGMTLEELQAWCTERGQTRFRGTQLFEWMYRHQVTETAAMTNISERFREYLRENCILTTLKLQKVSRSDQGTTQKLLLTTDDGLHLEAVSMLEENRHTVCLSSQIGCNVDCDFCATGSMGFLRNLSVGEIIDQLIAVYRLTEVPVTNIVFMGMGEPFLNYDRVLTAADIFHHRQGFDLGATRITISTSGILPGIKRFIREKRRYKLAVSLNATTEAIRTRIMPVNHTWSIDQIFAELRLYKSDSQRKIMFEYILMKDINDSPEDALRLVSMIKDFDCKLNIIPYNETDGRYQRPDEEVIEKFLEVLYNRRGNIQILVRWSKGQDIAAACGQLAVLNG
ncbi:MAG: 23S rRNA (adenine(2503)-C(2))-methyltransferase RlmN [FCB group bacterium]|nr:23S rRNA (adenine(2503)-C(2))-methyltransferase RlmN [FCB group bacterium]